MRKNHQEVINYTSTSVIPCLATTLSTTQEIDGVAVVTLQEHQDSNRSSIESTDIKIRSLNENDLAPARSNPAPPQYPQSYTPSSSSRPPLFSSLYTATVATVEAYKTSLDLQLDSLSCAPAYLGRVSEAGPSSSASAPEYTASSSSVLEDTKAALPYDTKTEKKVTEDELPPPAYTEGSSPLDGFSYVMAAAGGAASIITQVQQSGPAPINTLGDVGADENITMDLR